MYLIALITVCLKTCTISTEEDSMYYNVLDSFDNSLSEDLYNYQQKKISCTTMYLIALITVCLKTCTISTEDIVYYNVLDSFDNSLSEDLYNINRRR
jgi:hypothetical protein